MFKMDNKITIYSVSEVSNLIEQTISKNFKGPLSVQG